MLSNQSNKGRNNTKGGRGKGNNRKTGQGYQGYQAGPPIQPYTPYQLPSKDTNLKHPYPNKFQSHSNKQPGKKQANFANPENWARGGKTSDQGARGNYKGKAENFDPDYHKCFQANHVMGQQQQQFAIMPPPYMYQANAALPPLAPRVHFNQNQLVSNPFALNTEIVQPQEKPIFSQDGRFNASTDVFNENGCFAKFSETINANKVDCMCIFPNNEIYVKLDDDRDTIDGEIFIFTNFNFIYEAYNYDTMIMIFQKDDGLEHDTDDDEYQSSRFHRSRILNYKSSVIKDQSYANGHFKEGNVTNNNFYTYDIKDFDLIKAVEAELSEIGLPFDYSTKFSRIVNPMWATQMYMTHGQDAKVEHYLKPHFMDGHIKKDDYLYITTGYLQFDKTLLDSSDEDSSDEEDYVPYAYAKPLNQWRPAKFRTNFLVGRQLKQFVDIITMNAVHHTKFEHAHVLDVHFSMAQKTDDSNDSDSDVTAAPAKRQRG